MTMSREEYLDERKSLIELIQKASASFEYILLFLTSSAIWLSINSFGKLSTNIAFCSFCVSFLALVFSLFFQLFSRFLNERALFKESKLLAESYKNGTDMQNNYAGIPTFLAFVALLLFIIGVLSFLYFIVSR